MSTKRRSRHRIPPVALEPRPDPISERYQAEVDAASRRLERRYRKAQQTLELAERRAERAARIAGENLHSEKLQRQHQELLRIVEDRRRELREIELLMMPGNYNGRDSRRRGARHEAGQGDIALGGYIETEIR